MRNSLLSAISHDLRTPLTSIVGFASVLEEQQRIPNGSADTARELVHAIHEEALRMSGLVTNLLDNGIRYNQAGGWVRIHTGTADGLAILRIENSGPVIPPAEVARLFGPFQRLTPDRTGGASTGSGLGLSITKRIVEAQGGTVGLRSAPGRGSTFYATLPAPAVPEPVWLGAELDAPPSTRKTERSIAAGQPRVLAGR